MKTIALFMHHPECSRDCANAMTNALKDSYSIRLFNEDILRDDFFNSIDIIAFPGGIGDSNSHYKFFSRRVGNRIQKFIDNGGKYLGICMGAYWADEWYFDLLDGVRAIQYIKRPNADVRRSYGTVASVTWNGNPEKMYFYDGCALIGDETKFTTIAIIQGNIGIIGCHPEAPLYWYEKPWQYINKYWNGGRHHRLLLDFVNTLSK
jgi:hypothetical protein